MTSDRRRIEEHLNNLVGSLCWTVVGDDHPEVHIGFGGKIRRDRPLSNTKLSDEQRQWRPEFDILVHCSWRLQSPESVVAAAADGGAALIPLVGRAVESVGATPRTWDLVVRFAGGLELRVFADETRDGFQNFSVGVRDTYLTITAKSGVSWVPSS